jgi:hypothetical protein
MHIIDKPRPVAGVLDWRGTRDPIGERGSRRKRGVA